MDCSEKPVDFPNFYWQAIRNWFEIKKTYKSDNNSNGCQKGMPLAQREYKSQ
jgi:hypothetical protein